ncbi:hypothetical protein OAP79_01800 [Candidatus Pelagibacter sp.]|nr:hypothetical protein [Candidatus Pelagibacter sp.]
MMKKLSVIVFLYLLLSANSYAETLTLNCSFEKYVDQTNFLDEKIIPKNQLPTLITDDKFITLEIKSNNDIKILDTSFMIRVTPKIITPYKIDDNFIHFKEKENSSDKYSLDRRTGLVLVNYKSSKEKLRIYYSCVKKNKLF